MKSTGVHKVIETTTLATQVTQIHQMIKKNVFMSFDVPATKPIKVAEVARVYCEEPICL